MKKMNKKIISLILAMMMILSTTVAGVVAFAEDTEHNCSVDGHDYQPKFGGYCDAYGNDVEVDDNYKYTNEDGEKVAAYPYHNLVCSYCNDVKANEDTGNEMKIACKRAGGWQHDDETLTHYVGCEYECGLREHESHCADRVLNYVDSTGVTTTDGLCDVCGFELNHKYQKSGSVAPTCTSVGSETYTCINCSKNFTNTTASALGHHWPSSEDSEFLTVEWDEENCNWCRITFECEFGCGAKMSYTAYTNSGNTDNFIEKTEDAAATCGTAGGTVYTATFNIKDITINGWEAHTNEDGTYTYTTTYSTGDTPATGKHTFGDAVVTKEATCTAKGESTKTCTVCGKVETTEIAALGHNYELQDGKEATCTEAGYGKQVCSRCGDTINSDIPATGHSVASYAEEPTCTNAGIAVCSCGTKFAVSALGHKDANNDGNCDVCGESIVDPDIFSNIALSVSRPSTTVIPYGHSLVLKAKTNVEELPLGYSVIWELDEEHSDACVELNISDDGMTCEVKAVKGGKAVVIAKLCDASGNVATFENGRTVSDAVSVSTNVNFYQMVIYFFKTIFFMNKKIY